MTQSKANKARPDNSEMWLIYCGYSYKHRQEGSRPVTTNTAFPVPGIGPAPQRSAMGKSSRYPKHPFNISQWSSHWSIQESSQRRSRSPETATPLTTSRSQRRVFYRKLANHVAAIRREIQLAHPATRPLHRQGIPTRQAQHERSDFGYRNVKNLNRCPNVSL